MMKRLCRMAVSEFLSVHSNIEGRTLISYFIGASLVSMEDLDQVV
jgi:hypothetical protein